MKYYLQYNAVRMIMRPKIKGEEVLNKVIDLQVGVRSDLYSALVFFNYDSFSPDRTIELFVTEELIVFLFVILKVCDQEIKG